MLPFGSCTDAIAATVCAIWARVRTPSTSGRVSSCKAALLPSRHGRRHFLAVEDDALAEYRVERTFGDARPPRVVLDQHAEEVVIPADGCRFRVVDAVRALEPPVRRVERVRVVRAAQEEPGALDLLL